MDGQHCWVLQVRPRQILDKQRLFDSRLWIKKDDFSVIRSEGQAVPQIRNDIRKSLPSLHDGPASGERILVSLAQRERLTIDYSDYKKFGSESSITFEKP